MMRIPLSLHVASLAMICAAWFCDPAAAGVAIYPLPSCYSQSDVFSIKVDGKDVPVVVYMNNEKPEYHFAHFSFEGKVSIEVTAAEEVAEYKIRPLSYGIEGKAEGRRLTFELNRSRYLLLKINKLENLVIIADPAEQDVPAAKGEKIHNVLEERYGADGSGRAIATEAIQRAIDDAHAAGGGTVYVPAGVYKSGSLMMKGNVDLYMEGGAVLRGTGVAADFVQDNPGSKQSAVSTLVRFTPGDSKMTVRGRGTLDANGEKMYDDDGGKDPTALRLCILRPDKNSGVRMEGLIVSHGRTWTVVPQQSDNIVIENLKVLNSEFRSNNDGIDINSCQDVLVRHCFTYTNDDSMCAKPCSVGNFQGVIDGPDEEIRNVVFDDVVAYTRCSGAKVGLQGHTRASNVWFKNIEVLQGSRAVVVHHQQGGATMEDIHFVNINVEELRYRVYKPYPIQIEIFPKSTGNIRNVVVENVTFAKFGQGKGADGYDGEDSRILGRAEGSTVEGVTFRNLRIAGKLIMNTEEGRMNQNEFASGVTFEGSPGGD